MKIARIATLALSIAAMAGAAVPATAQSSYGRWNDSHQSQSRYRDGDRSHWNRGRDRSDERRYSDRRRDRDDRRYRDDRRGDSRYRDQQYRYDGRRDGNGVHCVTRYDNGQWRQRCG